MNTLKQFLFILVQSLSFVYASGQNIENLTRSTPESQGVSSASIIDFINAIDTGHIEIHSFMFLRHGKVIAEGWWNPYGPGHKHILYSASKTFAATGIGLAISENRLSLSDKVISFFPASLPDTISQYMREMSVRDLLMMSTGQDAEPRRGQNDDWIRSFISKAPLSQPGTIFKYNNTATFMLSAIVQQVTGETLYEYLTPRIFRPLGIRGIDWDLNAQGINLGMIGLRLKTEDMAKFGQLMMQQGEWNGKQLIPKQWIEEATTFKIKSQGGNEKIPAEISDWLQGYCYQMWRGRNNSVRLDGMSGQFVILLPDKDAVVVLTANAQDTQKELDLVWRYLLPSIKSDNPLQADPVSFNNLQKKSGSLTVVSPSEKPVNSLFASRITGKTIEFQQNNSGIKEMRLNFNNGICHILIKRESVTYNIKAGLDSWEGSETNLSSLLSAPRIAMKSRDANYTIQQPLIKVASYCSWTDKNTLELTSRFIEESTGAEGLILKFSEADGTLNVSLDRKSVRGSAMGFGPPRQPETLIGRIVQ